MRLRLKDVLEVLAQYEVHQRDLTQQGLAGDIDTTKSRIRIHLKLALRERVGTLIHEAVHAYYIDMGHIHTERSVEIETKRLMKELYGSEYGR